VLFYVAILTKYSRSLCKYVRNSCVLFSNASVLHLQQACNTHLSCRFTLQKCYKHVLMRLSSTRPVMYLLRAVYVAKMPQCIRFTSSTCLEMCLFHAILRRKFARNSHVSLRKCMSLTFRTCPIMCIFCVVLSHKILQKRS